MRRVFWISLVSVALSACATPYVPPREPPPAGWDGASGMVNLGPPTVQGGLRHAGDAVFSTPVGFVRTGVVAETVQTKSAYGGAMIFPKGSKAYATNYTLFSSSGYAPVKNAQPANDPIEWCIVVPNGFDGKKSGSQTACVFWESPTTARYMQDYSVGGFAFSPMLEFSSASGTQGPVPVIAEQPVDFGVRLTRELKIVEVEPKGVRIALVLSDGTNSRTLERRLLRWSKTGEAAVGGMVFRPAANDPTAVEASQR